MTTFKSALGATALSLVFLGSAYAADDKKISTQSPEEYEFKTERIVRLNEGVNEETALDVIRKLKYLDAHNPDKKDITLIVNSPGGTLTAALAIYDTMKSLKTPVKTVCEGRVYSAGAFLVAAGSPGKRFSQPNCRFMFHQPSAGNSGRLTDMMIYQEELSSLQDRYYDILSRSLNRRAEDLKKGLKQDYYIDAEKAIEFGAIDEVLKPQQIVPPVGVRPFAP